MSNIGYCPGVFDLFHSGHKNLLIKCSNLCDKLIVGVHFDNFVESYKRRPIDNQEIRKNNIIKYLKIPENNIIMIGGYHKDVIIKYKITKIFHGNDWEINSYKKQIGYYRDGLDKLRIKIELLRYTNGISTTKILTKNFIKTDYKTYLFDLDNTLILNNKPKFGSVECIDKLKEMKKEIYIISNNNYSSPSNIHISLNEIGINIPMNNIITSLTHVRDICLRYYNKKNIFVWGSKESIEWLKTSGLNIVGHEDNDIIDLAVVLYRNNYDYQQLVNLCNIINNTENYIIGNSDNTFPDSVNILPDTGSLSKLIIAATGKKPNFICGKPSKNMLPGSLIKPIIMFGDSLKTDKPFAQCCSIDFIHIDENNKNANMSHLGVFCDYLNLNSTIN